MDTDTTTPLCPHGLQVETGEPWPRPGFGVTRRCRPCYQAWLKSRGHVPLGQRTPPAVARRPLAAAVAPKPPCAYEGPVSEPCTKCNQIARELNHVRLCAHPSDEAPDKCVRGASASPDSVRSCAACPLHTTEPPPAATAAPAPAGPRKMLRWSYGVTTVSSRFDDLLPNTLSSLKAGGFDSPHIFVDGEPADANRWTSRFNSLTLRLRNSRTFGAWVMSLWELYVLDPTADRYALFQDDLECVRNLRAYLECLVLEPKTYWNLYTWPSNQKMAGDHVGLFKANQNGRGAVALVFDRAGVLDLLSSRHMVERPLDPHRGHKSVDGAVVTALAKAGYTEVCHSPSLTQHTGRVSSMGNREHLLAPSFPGAGFDALALLGART